MSKNGCDASKNAVYLDRDIGRVQKKVYTSVPQMYGNLDGNDYAWQSGILCPMFDKRILL